MEAKLIIVGGKANKGHVSLKLPTVVGRSREADLTIAHPMVSRRHCELFEENGLLMVRDLGSLNGTIVRKERITKAEPVRPKEEFTVGPLTFRAEYDYAGEIAAPPSPAPLPDEPPMFAVDGDEPPPEFFAGDEPSPSEGEPPAAKNGKADNGLPDFAAWDAASKKQGPAAPAAASSSSPETDTENAAASDFALGPIAPPSLESQKLLADGPASSNGDDSPPAFDGPPAFEAPSPAKSSTAAAKKKASEAAPASANGQKPGQPKEFSDEDLDEFFKDP